MENALPKKVTKDQSRDTGMAMVLLLLLLNLRLHRQGLLYGAVAVQVLNMIVPQIYKPIAVVWLGFSTILGNISSKVLMSILFFGVVTPIGILRRLSGKDALKLRAFKAGPESALVERNYTFTARDLERPY